VLGERIEDIKCNSPSTSKISFRLYKLTSVILVELSIRLLNYSNMIVCNLMKLSPLITTSCLFQLKDIHISLLYDKMSSKIANYCILNTMSQLFSSIINT